MTTRRYTPLPHWVLVALVTVFVNQVTSQPIQTQQWFQNVDFEDLGTREVWKTAERGETGSQLSQVGNAFRCVQSAFAGLTTNNTDENILL